MKDTTNITDACSVIYTIGYEGTDLDTFLSVLVDRGIEMLVDVRELPLSRKRGFSKKGLREALRKVGINYVHLKNLGDPKEGRLAARSGNYAEFRRVFSSHMETPEAQAGLSELAEIVNQTSACLLCFERCHKGCHRSMVVDRLSETTTVRVENLLI